MQSAAAGGLIGAWARRSAICKKEDSSISSLLKLSLRSVALDRVRGRNKRMVRVRRYYHGGFAARIESDTLPTAQTPACGSLDKFEAFRLLGRL